MNLQEEALKAYHSEDLTSALILARKALEKGYAIEPIYRIISECELKTGDVGEGFTICLKLAKQVKNLVSIERLIHWTGSVHAGFVRPDGGFNRQEFSKDQLEKILETVISSTKANSRSDNSEITNKVWCRIIQGLGCIGYLIDETPYEGFKEFATRFFTALPIESSLVPKACVVNPGLTSDFRWIGYLLSSAGLNDEAEEVMEKISVPYLSEKQLETIPTGMKMPEKISSVEFFERPHLIRNSRCLVRLTEGRLQLGRVLDIGCGTGLTSSLIRDRSDFIHGVDCEEEWLKAALGKNIFDQLDNADFLDWQQPGEKFDTIVSSGVANIIPRFEQLVSKMGSLLKKEGRAYINVMTCSGAHGQRQLDNYVLRTRYFIAETVRKSHLRIVQETVGPSQNSVGTYMELGRVK